MKKTVLVRVFQYGLGFGLLAYLAWANREMLGRLASGEQPIHPAALALAAVLCLASVLQTFVRWFVLVRAQGLPIRLGETLRLAMMGYYFNIYLPGSVGGDILKAAFLARAQERRTAAVTTVLIDRVVGLWGLAWLVALLGGAFWLGGFFPEEGRSYLETIVLAAAGLVAATVVAWLLLGLLPVRRAERFAGRLGRIPKVGRAVAELWRAVWTYRREGRGIGLALVMALVGHVGFVLTYYFAARTLFRADEIPPLRAHFLLIPIIMVFQAGFPAPGGMGGGELALGWLYGLVNPAFAHRGALACFMYRLITWALAFASYMTYLQMRSTLGPAASAATAGADPPGREGAAVTGRPGLVPDP